MIKYRSCGKICFWSFHQNNSLIVCVYGTPYYNIEGTHTVQFIWQGGVDGLGYVNFNRNYQKTTLIWIHTKLERTKIPYGYFDQKQIISFWKKGKKLFPDIIVHGTIINMILEILLFNGKHIF
jgi:hypothetical protein